jgi:hypothetical protein
MRRTRRLIMLLIALAALVPGGLAFLDYARRHPQELPWTALDLRQPVGAFTGRKLAADPGFACPLAAALVVREREVVQAAAQRHFGRRVAGIDHFGSYSCRRMYGRDEGAWSEHARANAFDIAAFRLDDGTRIAVVNDWRDPGAKGRFLREVRDGACRLFATILSPGYNAAHRDHLHLDQAARGEWGWRACR